jgi:hypothetical protein
LALNARSLEGSVVSVAHRDGRRFDGLRLMAADRDEHRLLWLAAGDRDYFVSLVDVVDVWASR